VVRPLAGLITVVVIAGVVALAAFMFRGGFTPAVAVTVLSPRAGLVMNPDAKVTWYGAQVGKVASIAQLPDGGAALHLAMDPAQLHLIPANVSVDIASTTIFGAKQVALVPPPRPVPQRLRAGQVLDTKHVMVEINTIFEQLTSVLSTIEPDKLNATLTALATAANGRGNKIGETLVDLNRFLATLDPSLPALSHDLQVAPQVLNAYADAAPDLLTTADNVTRISQSIVEEQENLDTLLVSTIGLADIGTQVLGDNRQGLTDVLHLLIPTTDLSNEYSPALNCGIAGLIPLAKAPPRPDPGAPSLVSLSWSQDRYRYPGDLPKVAAKGGPQCTGLPLVPFEGRMQWVVADIGTNPWKYGNQGVVLNSDALKQFLFGPVEGPPRNSAQIGQPG
jgi:virulence factor Mce-like protein